MSLKKWSFRALVFTIVLYLLGTIALAEISLHPVRIHRGERLARLTTLAAPASHTPSRLTTSKCVCKGSFP